MNVALFLDCFYPMKNGVITSAMQLKEGLEKKGHHVVIVSLRAPGYPERHPDILLFPMIPMDFGSKQNFGPAIIFPGRLLAFLRRNKIDIIHSHTEFTLGYASLFAAWRLGLPRVATSHTLWSDYSNYNILLRIKPVLYTLMRTYYRGIKAIIAPSVKSKRFNDILVPKVSKYIVPNGINASSFRGKPVSDEEKALRMRKYGIQPDDDVLIFVGRIGPEKRVMNMLSAFVPLMIKRRNLKLMFVGDGPDRSNLVSKAAQRGVSNQIVFTGFVNWEEVHILYSFSRMFVSASLSEMHPMTYIEATMSGIPIVARKDDSCVDLVLNDKNGYLVDTDSGMAEKVELLLSDRIKLSVFGKASYEHSKNFTAENNVNRVLEVYEKVLSAQSRRK